MYRKFLLKYGKILQIALCLLLSVWPIGALSACWYPFAANGKKVCGGGGWELAKVSSSI
jgi:hypothetical protein